jgi:hypothetical protein
MTGLTGVPADGILGTDFAATIADDEERDNWISGFRSISNESPEICITVRWGRADVTSPAWTTKCVLVAGAELVVCTVLESASSRRPQNLFGAVLAERTAEFKEISRFLHDTIAQDLVQLSFLVEKLDRSGGPLLSRVRSDAAEMLERCCGRIRVLGAMLSIPPQGAAFQAWLEGYAVFLREETGLILELDIDPTGLETAAANAPLPAIALHIWIGKAIRMGPVNRVVVRLREKESGVLLELEASQTAPGSFLSGWSALREVAEAGGGNFNVTERDTHSSARLWLPAV